MCHLNQREEFTDCGKIRKQENAFSLTTREWRASTANNFLATLRRLAAASSNEGR
jgi:hypothetical protein